VDKVQAACPFEKEKQTKCGGGSCKGHGSMFSPCEDSVLRGWDPKVHVGSPVSLPSALLKREGSCPPRKIQKECSKVRVLPRVRNMSCVDFGHGGAFEFYFLYLMLACMFLLSVPATTLPEFCPASPKSHFLLGYSFASPRLCHGPLPPRPAHHWRRH